MPTRYSNLPVAGVKHYAVSLANHPKFAAVNLINVPITAVSFTCVDQFSQLTHVLDIKRCFEDGAPMILIDRLEEKTT